MVLISTVDVYPTPIGVDEDSPIDDTAADPYGRHRRMLEQFVEQRFSASIVRLPGLFGPGLKKNVIYDFLHRNRLDLINPGSTFQFYDLADLWRDIGSMRRSGIRLMNFATEPVSVRDVAEYAFGFTFDNAAPPRPAHYDFRTRWAEQFGGAGGYIRTRAEVLGAMRDFVSRERSSAAGDIEHRMARGR
jgi:nucleoside-diphosphate-sugar epimerase